MKDFYVFRHGETSYNVGGHIQGRSTDPQYADTRFEGGETKNEVRARVFEALNFYIAALKS